MKLYKRIINIFIITIVAILICINNTNVVYGKTKEEAKQELINNMKDQSNIDGVQIDKDNKTEESSKPKSDLEDPTKNPDFYEPKDTTGDNTKFIEIGNLVIGTMRVVGTVVAVIAIMIIGLRYMFASLAERATYKETMIPYIIGAIMVFTIPHVLGIIYDLVKGIQF